MFTLPVHSVRCLSLLTGSRAYQIVWDINALYVVGPNDTTKIEAVAAVPESPEPHRYDEVFPIVVHVLPAPPLFNAEGEAGYEYRVLAENEYITQIQLVRVAVLFPSEELAPPSTVAGTKPGTNLVDCGVFIHTPRGVLAAFQAHPTFGFGSSTQARLLSVAEANTVLPPPYELVSLVAAA